MMIGTLRVHARRLLIASALFAIGCTDATSLMVEVTSNDLVIPADVDALRFQVESESGRSVDETFQIERAWPHSLAVLPASDDDVVVRITVTGLLDGTAVIRRHIDASFTSGVQKEIEVQLDRACLGLPCGEGVDCVDGMCIGGQLDGGMPDAGPADAGELDAAVADAGTDAAVPDAGTDAGMPDAGRTPADLLFTEYVEGSGNNKALEILNQASGSFDLSRCVLNRYSNGDSTPFLIELSGTILAGEMFVICNTSIEVTTACDLLTGSLNHNGDDSLALACDGASTPVDTFGQVGADPGTAWGPTDGIQTAEHVLTRKCEVSTGDTNGADAFDPTVEWEGTEWSGTADLAGLGTRAECP